MARYDDFLARLRAGEKILIDGGTGTESERRGIPQLDNAWNGSGPVTHPSIIQGIHEDFISAGAEIIITNTFSTSKHALRDAGKVDEFARHNRRAVELALEARKNKQTPNVMVAGGVAYWSWSGNHPPLAQLEADVTEQVEIMAESGVDFLMLEMMIGIDRMLTTLKAAKTVGLPIWVGLSCRPAPNGAMCLFNEEPLGDAIDALNGHDIPLISIMHSRIEYIDTCLDIVDQHWDGLVGVYAHTSREVDGAWNFHDAISPEGYAAHCQRWLARDVRLIGGCCGMTPEHIKAIKAVL